MVINWIPPTPHSGLALHYLMMPYLYYMHSITQNNLSFKICGFHIYGAEYLSIKGIYCMSLCVYYAILLMLPLQCIISKSDTIINLNFRSSPHTTFNWHINSVIHRQCHTKIRHRTVNKITDVILANDSGVQRWMETMPGGSIERY